MLELKAGEKRPLTDFVAAGRVVVRLRAAGVGDAMCLIADSAGRVLGEEDVLTWARTSVADGAVVATPGATPGVVSMLVDTLRLPDAAHRLVFAIVAGKQPLGRTGVSFVDPVSKFEAGRALFTTDTPGEAFVVAEIYRRGEHWRVGVVGQTYSAGLTELLGHYGLPSGPGPGMRASSSEAEAGQKVGAEATRSTDAPTFTAATAVREPIAVPPATMVPDVDLLARHNGLGLRRCRLIGGSGADRVLGQVPATFVGRDGRRFVVLASDGQALVDAFSLRSWLQTPQATWEYWTRDGPVRLGRPQGPADGSVYQQLIVRTWHVELYEVTHIGADASEAQFERAVRLTVRDGEMVTGDGPPALRRTPVPTGVEDWAALPHEARALTKSVKQLARSLRKAGSHADLAQRAVSVAQSCADAVERECEAGHAAMDVVRITGDTTAMYSLWFSAQDHTQSLADVVANLAALHRRRDTDEPGEFAGLLSDVNRTLDEVWGDLR